MAKTVVGLYNRLDQAQEVVNELVTAGIERENISMVASDSKGEHASQLQADETQKKDPVSGAGMGAAVGGLAGLLVGFGAMAIPGLGPAVAAGPLVAALSGAGVGAVAGGIAAALVDAGVSEADADIYAEGVRRGGTLLTVYASNEQADLAADIMNRYHPVNVQQRAEMWRQGNWNTFDEGAEPFAFDRIKNDLRQDDKHGVKTDNDQRLYGDMESGFQGIEQAAYTFGYREAHDHHNRDKIWQAVEDELRRLWVEQHPEHAWEEYRDLVNEGWLAGKEQ